MQGSVGLLTCLLLFCGWAPAESRPRLAQGPARDVLGMEGRPGGRGEAAAERVRWRMRLGNQHPSLNTSRTILPTWGDTAGAETEGGREAWSGRRAQRFRGASRQTHLLRRELALLSAELKVQRPLRVKPPAGHLQVGREVDIKAPVLPHASESAGHGERDTGGVAEQWRAELEGLAPPGERTRGGGGQEDLWAVRDIATETEAGRAEGEGRRWRRPRSAEGEDCDGEGRCCRRSRRVSFKDIGWADWVMAPEAYTVYFCDGACPHNYRPASMHTQVKARLHHMTQGATPRPCCVPAAYEPMVLLHHDSQGKLTLTSYNGMIVSQPSLRSSLTAEKVLFGPSEGCRTPELQRQWRIMTPVKQIIYVNKEEQRSQHRSLRDTTAHSTEESPPFFSVSLCQLSLSPPPWGGQPIAGPNGAPGQSQAGAAGDRTPAAVGNLHSGHEIVKEARIDAAHAHGRGHAYVSLKGKEEESSKNNMATSNNPRKFSEKIALHNQKQAEETAAFEEVMKDLSITRAARLQLQKTQYLQLGQNRGQCYGGSLPNVNQIGNGTTDSPFQPIASPPLVALPARADSGETGNRTLVSVASVGHSSAGRPQTSFQTTDLDTSRTNRHHGLVDRVYRDRNRITSPHRRPLSNSTGFQRVLKRVSPFLSLTLRATLTAVPMVLCICHLHLTPAGGALFAVSVGVGLQTGQGVPNPLPHGLQDQLRLCTAPKHPEPGSSGFAGGSQDLQPNLCLSIFPSPDQEMSTSLIPATHNTGGSLPDLTNIQFPPPLPTPLDPEDTATCPALSANNISLTATLTHLGLTSTSQGVGLIQPVLTVTTQHRPQDNGLGNTPLQQLSPSLSPPLTIAQAVTMDTMTLEQQLSQYPFYCPTTSQAQDQQAANQNAQLTRLAQVPPLSITTTSSSVLPQTPTTAQTQTTAVGMDINSHTSILSSIYGDGFYEQQLASQQTSALSHQLEQFNMMENPISSSSLYTQGSTLNYTQAAMMGLTGSHGTLQDSQQLGYSNHGNIIPNIILTVTGESPPSLSKELSGSLSTDVSFDGDSQFPLDELKIDPLTLDGLHMLNDPDMVLADAATEDTVTHSFLTAVTVELSQSSTLLWNYMRYSCTARWQVFGGVHATKNTQTVYSYCGAKGDGFPCFGMEGEVPLLWSADGEDGNVTKVLWRTEDGSVFTAVVNDFLVVLHGHPPVSSEDSPLPRPPIPTDQAMTAASATPQQMRDRLLQAIDSHSNQIRNMVAVLEVISHLEKYPITKEALEETRLGKLINDVRKKTKDEDLAKRGGGWGRGGAGDARLSQWRRSPVPGRRHAPHPLSGGRPAAELKSRNDFHNTYSPKAEKSARKRKGEPRERDGPSPPAKVSKTTTYERIQNSTPPPTNGIGGSPSPPPAPGEPDGPQPPPPDPLGNEKHGKIPVNAVRPHPSSPGLQLPAKLPSTSSLLKAAVMQQHAKMEEAAAAAAGGGGAGGGAGQGQPRSPRCASFSPRSTRQETMARPAATPLRQGCPAPSRPAPEREAEASGPGPSCGAGRLESDGALEGGKRRKKKYRPRDYTVNLGGQAEERTKPVRLKERRLTFDPATGQIKSLTHKEPYQGVGEEPLRPALPETLRTEPPPLPLPLPQPLPLPPPLAPPGAPLPSPFQQTNWKELSRNEIIQFYLNMQSNVLTSSGAQTPGAHFFMSEYLRGEERHIKEARKTHVLVPSSASDAGTPGVSREVTPADLRRLSGEHWPGVNGCSDTKDNWYDWTQCISLDPHGDESKLNVLPYVSLD
ncbi:hypothetical protein AAFF_G00221880 [Aldrovandia affinis]|uniref:Mediator of RNA polymerase II transcription subunit 26 n=1 Tax=Aldrovandia affinis TaxID=143900 RepID=A0AAD7RFU7_9TELE|nr:hypothetical protein AAFF_G00221880 [Aldrovandia affinis]